MIRGVARAGMAAIMLAGSFHSSAAEEIPMIEAKVTYPVLQELMGGCSLRCAFFWETLAGNPAKPACELCDDDAMTGWMAPDDWKNAPIIFIFPKNSLVIAATPRSTASRSPTA